MQALLTATLLLSFLAAAPDAPNAAGQVSELQPASRPAAEAQDPAAEAQAPKFDFTPGGPISDAQLSEYHVEMQCAVGGKDVGTMTLVFWPEKAPITVRNFLRYCSDGFYDGLTFHRVMRTFMVQGGDPAGTGSGGGPYGAIKGEFSRDKKYSHVYGVISMARTNDPDSATCQFFICCDTSPGTRGLDGAYASFGYLVGGAKTLEAVANVPVRASMTGEPSVPTQKVTITRATVKSGAPKGGTKPAVRPKADLGGEPEQVSVQHCLISFKDVRQVGATRTKAEAEKLAKKILEDARKGADFTALVRQYSDDPVDPDDPKPGVYRMTNRGVQDEESVKVRTDLEKEWNAFIEDLQKKVADGEMTQAESNTAREEHANEIRAKLTEIMVYPREQMAPAFGDVAFELKVGEFGIAEFDAAKSPFGWHIILRIR